MSQNPFGWTSQATVGRRNTANSGGERFSSTRLLDLFVSRRHAFQKKKGTEVPLSYLKMLNRLFECVGSSEVNEATTGINIAWVVVRLECAAVLNNKWRFAV